MFEFGLWRVFGSAYDGDQQNLNLLIFLFPPFVLDVTDFSLGLSFEMLVFLMLLSRCDIVLPHAESFILVV